MKCDVCGEREPYFPLLRLCQECYVAGLMWAARMARRDFAVIINTDDPVCKAALEKAVAEVSGERWKEVPPLIVTGNGGAANAQ